VRINSEWLIVELLSLIVKILIGFSNHNLWPTVFRWAVYCGLFAQFGNTVGPAPTEEYPRRTRISSLFVAGGLAYHPEV
jgi:hypothetical protein